MVMDETLRALTDATLRIRALEHLLLDLFRDNRVAGTVHTCIGQEFCATCLHAHLRPEVDVFVGSHRAHGHYLAAGGPAEGLLAELMGRQGAICGGRGGSQHLHACHVYTSGIQGGGSVWATGMAWAQALDRSGGIAVVQLGDGTLGEGAVYEAFTFAALRRAPILFYLEWNGWAQSTDTAHTTSGDVLARARSFGLEAHRMSDADPVALWAHLATVVNRVREGVPTLQVVDTRRLAAHSKGDDTRSLDQLDALRQEDTLTRLIETHPDVRARYDAIALELATLADEIWTRPAVAPTAAARSAGGDRGVSSATLAAPCDTTVVASLNEALASCMAEDDQVILVGEDLTDPYGGAFKVTRGLSSRFPVRVIATPVAEAAIVGVCSGLALRGWRPVAEIMFADFAALAADQLVNHAAKFRFMYGAACPLVVRLPSGGRRGYGPTHSQCLESLFIGVPGLRVVSLSARHHAGALLREVIAHAEDPTLFVEPKRLYAERQPSVPLLDLVFQTTVGTLRQLPALYYRARTPAVTLVTYGGCLQEVEQAIVALFVTHEVDADLVVLTQLWPLALDEVLDSATRSTCVLVVEEGVASGGVGGAVLTALSERGVYRARALGAVPTPIPAARHLEDAVLPSAQAIVQAVLEML